ncbi:ABC transporter substrate-binding protein [Rhodovarius crocodyli]|uniref:ABC transporter substrate-binding protein n=1 Tax=Rhodovarius crocodyli TaxID=1979269 RepID=A0A437MNP2_9PROT|nr:ABC transporter substrate-binding protein [Rhodovarius crocodyli]RVT99258.1 ABC transporter substrate-binding protein [Rhodovarius crocodyli]
MLRTAAAIGLALASAIGVAQAQNLTMAVGAPVTSLDPHYHQLSPNNAAASMIYSRLVETDNLARMQPGLALSWTAVEPTVWEFKLRPGVRFHNGREFTADDVAFTLARIPTVPNSPASFTTFVRPITRVEVVDPLTIRLHTATPYPLLPMDLTNIFILDRETHEGATTERFNSGELAIGTGPFRMTRHANGDRIELERNDQYFGERPAYARVTYRMITNDSARTAALLAGDVDVIDQVPTADIARLRRDNRVSLQEITGLRLIYLSLDHMREDGSPFITDNDGRPLPRNPLKDLRVRQALSIAIDRPAIVARVMEGSATATGQFLAEGIHSHIPGYPVPAFDADRARRLLAEAGYPNGFRITLHGPNDRYPNDARIIQAIGQMWTRAGVRTAVEAQTWSTFVGRAGRQEFSAFLLGWGMNPDGSHPLRNLIACYNRDTGLGASNRGRYCNPELDRGLAASSQNLDPAAREQQLLGLERMALEDVAVIPLHIQTNVWAARRGFAITPRADELTRAQDVRPAN